MEWELWVFTIGALVWGWTLFYFQLKGRRHASGSSSWLTPKDDEGRRLRRGYFLALVVGFIGLIAWGLFGIAKIQNR
jgi:hypothetical protein